MESNGPFPLTLRWYAPSRSSAASLFLPYPNAWIQREDYNRSCYFLFWKERMRPPFYVTYRNTVNLHRFLRSPVNKNYLSGRDRRYTYYGDQYTLIENWCGSHLPWVPSTD